MAIATATAIMLGLEVGGSILKGVGSVKAGNAAKELGDYNAEVATKRSADAIARGKDEEARFRLGVKSLIGSQRAGFAGQNVDVGIGSAVDVQADAAFLGELDALTIRTNARREAWGYQVEAENFKRGGQNAQNAGRWDAAGSLLSGGASLIQAKYGWGR